jgi:hypothetical protein
VVAEQVAEDVDRIMIQMNTKRNQSIDQKMSMNETSATTVTYYRRWR